MNKVRSAGGRGVILSATVLFLFVSCLCAAQEKVRTTPSVLQTKTGTVNVERLAVLNEPWGMAYLPDGRLLITEKPGRLRVYSEGKPLDSISGLPKVAYHGQGGLLGIAVDPNFAGSKYLYLYFTEAAANQPKGAQDPGDPRFGDFKDTADVVQKGGAVARARLEGKVLKDLRIIWRQEPKTIGRGHFGGQMTFAPDGKLYITSGERMRFDPAQDPRSNLGKIIRINPDGSIPKDNPFVNKTGARPDIWSSGHRNPLGIAVHPETKEVWINEMGPWHGDEINIPKAGQNYGWPLASNGDNYDGSPIPDHAARPQFAAPIYYWHPAISPAGLIFYTGDRFSSWRGNALLGGLSSEALIRLSLKGNQVVGEERLAINRRIRNVIQAPDGSVLLLTDYKDGELLRLRPAGK